MAMVKLGKIRARRDRPGTYEATYYVNGLRRRVLAESREAVSSKVANLLKEAESEPEETSAWDPDVSLSVYAEHWLDNVLIENIEPTTVRQYRQLLSAHVVPFQTEGRPLGGMKIRDIRRRHIKALLISKRKDGYAKDTVRYIRAALSSLLTDAVDDEIIELNPALQISNRKKKRADSKNQAEFEESIVPMSAEQFAAFVEAAADPREREFGPFFVALGKTGLRPSEAIALTPFDIDEKRRKVGVNKVYVLNSGRVRPYTKTGFAREVDLSPDLLELLRRHLARQREDLARRREEAFKDGKPVPKAPEMLFPNRAGDYIDWNNAADAFHRICRNAKVGRFRPYALRHTFATILLAEGAPITYVASQLGHSKPTTTLRYYAKWLPGRNDHYIDLVDSAGKTDSTASAQAV